MSCEVVLTLAKAGIDVPSDQQAGISVRSSSWVSRSPSIGIISIWFLFKGSWELSN